jgi:signal transduction histidine kinase
VPVQVGNKVIAVLHAQSSQVGAFGADEVRLCTTVAGHLGMALDNARLYQRLAAQTAELSQAYDELQEINRLGNELVQNVSHELRTPLGLIHGYVHLLLEGELGPLHDGQQTALRVIRDRTATLGRLIHNLTVLRSMPLEVLVLAPVSIVEAARQALAGFSHSAEQAGISFREDLPQGLPPVLSDPERLELAFGHLIDNAIKFSPGGGTVTLRAWSDQDWVHLSVSDQGIGIAPEHLKRIFERFYQVDGTTTRRFSGMGVGLALVWEIVEVHGGTVDVESEPGQGSTFTISLPAAHDRARTSGPTS